MLQRSSRRRSHGGNRHQATMIDQTLHQTLAHNGTAGRQQSKQTPMTRQRAVSGKVMLDKLRNFASSVGDALTDSLLPNDDAFIEYWSKVEKFFRSQSHRKHASIRETSLGDYLHHMLVCLYKERGFIDDSEEGSGVGPCVQVMLEEQMLISLVRYSAESSVASGIKLAVLQFFIHVIGLLHLSQFTDSRVKQPLISVLRHCHEVVRSSPAVPFGGTPASPLPQWDAARSPVGSSGDGDTSASASAIRNGYLLAPRDTSIALLRHELVVCVWALMDRLGEHQNMSSIFFDWGTQWNRSHRKGTRASGDGPADAPLPQSPPPSATAHTDRLQRLDPEELLMRIIFDSVLTPGATGQFARESLVMFARVLLMREDASMELEFLTERICIAKVLVDILSYLYPRLPLSHPAVHDASNIIFTPSMAPVRSVNPLVRRLWANRLIDSLPASIAQRVAPPDLLSVNSEPQTRRKELVGMPGPYDFPALFGSDSDGESRLKAVLSGAARPIDDVDAVFICWELLDEISLVAGRPEITSHIKAHLGPAFITPNLLMHLESPNVVMASTTTTYLSEFIKCTYSPQLLELIFYPLLGSNLDPEPAPSQQQQARSKGDLEPGASEHVRDILIGRISHEHPQLSLATLQLFDAIVGTCDQFAVTSLVHRNFPQTLLQRSCDNGGNRSLGAYFSPSLLVFKEDNAVDEAGLVIATTVADRLIAVSPSNIADAFPEAIMAMAYSAPIHKALSSSSSSSSSTDRNGNLAMATSMANSGKSSKASADTLVFPPINDDDSDDDKGNNSKDCAEGTKFAGRVANAQTMVSSGSTAMSPLPKRRTRRLSYADAVSAGTSEGKRRQSISHGNVGGHTAGQKPSATEAEGHAPYHDGCSPGTSAVTECEMYVQERLDYQWLVYIYVNNFWAPDLALARTNRLKSTFSRAAEPIEVNSPLDRNNDLYPGSFVSALLLQVQDMLRSNMAYNLVLTNIFTKLLSFGNDALARYLLVDSKTFAATVSPPTSGTPCLVDMLASVSAEAHIKSETIPSFADYLTKQRIHGVEHAICSGVQPQAASPRMSFSSGGASRPQVSVNTQEPRSRSNSSASPLGSYAAVAAPPVVVTASSSPSSSATTVTSLQAFLSPMYVTASSGSSLSRDAILQSSDALGGSEFTDLTSQLSSPPRRQRRSSVVHPIKRFINAYLVLDEFCKELAGAALAYYSVAVDIWFDHGHMKAGRVANIRLGSSAGSSVAAPTGSGADFASTPPQTPVVHATQHDDSSDGDDEGLLRQAAKILGEPILELKMGLTKMASQEARDASGDGGADDKDGVNSANRDRMDAGKDTARQSRKSRRKSRRSGVFLGKKANVSGAASPISASSPMISPTISAISSGPGLSSSLGSPAREDSPNPSHEITSAIAPLPPTAMEAGMPAVNSEEPPAGRTMHPATIDGDVGVGETVEANDSQGSLPQANAATSRKARRRSRRKSNGPLSTTSTATPNNHDRDTYPRPHVISNAETKDLLLLDLQRQQRRRRRKSGSSGFRGSSSQKPSQNASLGRSKGGNGSAATRREADTQAESCPQPSTPKSGKTPSIKGDCNNNKV